MNWQTIFEVSRPGLLDLRGDLYIAAALAAVGLIFYLRARKQKQRSMVAIAMTVFACVVLVFAYGVGTWDRWRLANRLAEGSPLQAQGLVTGHAVWRDEVSRAPGETLRRFNHWERVEVGGVSFIWTPGAHEAGFTNAQTPALQIQDGLLMRIAYVEDVAGEAHQRRILRLEVADIALQPDAEGPLPNAPFPSTYTP